MSRNKQQKGQVPHLKVLVPQHVHLLSAKDSNGRACVLRIGTVKSIFKEAVLFCVELDNTATSIPETQLFMALYSIHLLLYYIMRLSYKTMLYNSKKRKAVPT